MTKNGKLLVRIDERLKTVQTDTQEIKKETKTHSEQLIRIDMIIKENTKDINNIKKEHKKPFHQGTILGLVRFFFGR